jgi:hypothetical protein
MSMKGAESSLCRPVTLRSHEESGFVDCHTQGPRSSCNKTDLTDIVHSRALNRDKASRPVREGKGTKKSKQVTM